MHKTILISFMLLSFAIISMEENQIPPDQKETQQKEFVAAPKAQQDEDQCDGLSCCLLTLFVTLLESSGN